MYASFVNSLVKKYLVVILAIWNSLEVQALHIGDLQTLRSSTFSESNKCMQILVNSLVKN